MPMCFHFQNFSLAHSKSTLKIGTDSVLLSAVVPVANKMNILDVGTGCGVILFCLADKLRNKATKPARFLGIDIDRDSIEEATENLHHFPEIPEINIAFQHRSLQELSQISEIPFDLIISNPPFFYDSLKPDNPSLLKSKHRDNNLSFCELVDGVLKLLSEDGDFYLILPPDEYLKFSNLAENHLFLSHFTAIIPKCGKPANRVIAGFRKKRTETVAHSQIIIRDENGRYTGEYRETTKNFYLRFD